MDIHLGPSGDELIRKNIKVGSRKSHLALVQTNWVIDQLKKYHPDVQFEVITMDTIGDNILDRPLAKIGEKALFTRELEDELLAGKIDIIVHSLKDLPTTLPDKCCIGAITEREDPSDSLVLRSGLSLSGDRLGSVLADQSIQTFGTSSLRRIAQLRSLSGNVVVKDVRGNLNTRIRKLDDHEAHGFDCLVLATAGLKRGGFGERISLRLDWYHAVSQGALGVECRLDDKFIIRRILSKLIDRKAMLECTAERVLMKCLEGGCSVPIGVRTRWEDENTLTLQATVLSLDGTRQIESSATQNLNDTITDNIGSFTIHDFSDVVIEQLEPEFKVRVKNSLLLGRNLANKMIDLGVKDILAEIEKVKLSHS